MGSRKKKRFVFSFTRIAFLVWRQVHGLAGPFNYHKYGVSVHLKMLFALPKKTAASFVAVNKVRGAVKKGLVALVTHVERRRWDKTLELVLSRQTFTNSDGILQVTMGKTAVEYNPSFRLYLSSSLPLFMSGEGQCPLPFSKTSTISMDVSREGICDMLLADTLRLERPEFDGQLRSIERDVGLHKQQIYHAKVLLIKDNFIRASTFRKISSNLERKLH